MRECRDLACRVIFEVLLHPVPEFFTTSGGAAEIIGRSSSGDAFADLLVDVAPVFERTRQHRRGHAFLEVTDDVGYQTAARRIIHNLAHQRAGLAPIVVVLSQGVSGVDEFAVSLPLLHVGKAFRIGRRPTPPWSSARTRDRTRS